MNHLPADNLKYCNDALALRESIENDFLVLGEYLYNIREHNLFEPQWSSFVEFCFELRMSQSNINRLIQIHERFVLEYGFKREEITRAGASLLSDIMPAISTRKQAVKWLEKATLLTRQDLRKELTEFKTGIQMKDCKHKDTYTVEICRNCGERKQIK